MFCLGCYRGFLERSRRTLARRACGPQNTFHLQGAEDNGSCCEAGEGSDDATMG
jgi:hypothetical protein